MRDAFAGIKASVMNYEMGIDSLACIQETWKL
jgi:hypothetical protein